MLGEERLKEAVPRVFPRWLVLFLSSLLIFFVCVFFEISIVVLWLFRVFSCLFFSSSPLDDLCKLNSPADRTLRPLAALSPLAAGQLNPWQPSKGQQ